MKGGDVTRSIFILRQLAWAVFLVYIVSFVIIWLSFTAGDPAAAIAPNASPEVLQNIRDANGWNDSIFVLHSRYMWGFIQGDFGESITLFRGQPVWDLLKPRIPISLQLGLATLVTAYVIGIPLGAISAVSHIEWIGPFKPKTRRLIDSFVVGNTLALRSIPTLIVVPVLIFFLVSKLQLLPASGWNGLFSKTAIIPYLSMASGGFVGVALLVRASMLSSIEQPFVETLRAKGLGGFKITLHILRNSLLPLVTGLQGVLTLIVGGSFFVELLYGIPGMQIMLINALQAFDVNVYLPPILLQVLLFIVGRTGVDIGYTMLDPRVTLEGKR